MMIVLRHFVQVLPSIATHHIGITPPTNQKPHTAGWFICFLSQLPLYKHLQWTPARQTQAINSVGNVGEEATVISSPRCGQFGWDWEHKQVPIKSRIKLNFKVDKGTYNFKLFVTKYIQKSNQSIFLMCQIYCEK